MTTYNAFSYTYLSSPAVNISSNTSNVSYRLYYSTYLRGLFTLPIKFYLMPSDVGISNTINNIIFYVYHRVYLISKYYEILVYKFRM